jgi:hypothetical protein
MLSLGANEECHSSSPVRLATLVRWVRPVGPCSATMGNALPPPPPSRIRVQKRQRPCLALRRVSPAMAAPWPPRRLTPAGHSPPSGPVRFVGEPFRSLRFPWPECGGAPDGRAEVATDVFSGPLPHLLYDLCHVLLISEPTMKKWLTLRRIEKCATCNLVAE